MRSSQTRLVSLLCISSLTDSDELSIGSLDGVRAGAKRLGRRKERERTTTPLPHVPRPYVLYSI